MLEPFRSQFNAAFTPGAYLGLKTNLSRQTRTEIDFRVCETPAFFPLAMLDQMADYGRAMTSQLVGDAAYTQASNASIPEAYRVAGENPQPNFMTVDFGLVAEDDASGGRVLKPKLVELQAFPSIYGYQDLLAREYLASYGLSHRLRWYLGGHDETSYWALLRRVIVGNHQPENVVLVDVEPEKQKTLPDFRVYEDRLGVATVDIAKIRKVGRRLQYERQGPGPSRWVTIERIFNRAIVDEMERKNVVLNFDYRDDLDVEWAGHPNWYFRVSKFSLPYLDHPCVPPAVFLDDWFAGKGVGRLPAERERILLKPLYSFAGKGIQFATSDADLAAIAPEKRPLYLLQERVHFEPVIATPHGMTQAEIRIMYLWPDGGAMEPVISLVRMGRGSMMGVDQNRDQEWVGGSAALFPFPNV